MYIKAIAIYPMVSNEIVTRVFIACVYIYDTTLYRLSHTYALFGFSERATSS